MRGIAEHISILRERVDVLGRRVESIGDVRVFGSPTTATWAFAVTVRAAMPHAADV
jgi:hypothetical protein